MKRDREKSPSKKEWKKKKYESSDKVKVVVWENTTNTAGEKLQ